MGLSLKEAAGIMGLYPLSDKIDYTPYSFTDVKVLLGAPPMPVVGLDFVSARSVNPPRKRFQGLTGKAVFVSNNNQAGIIEFGTLSGSLSQGYIEIMQLTGIPYPIIIGDVSGTGGVIATACQLVETPEWRRALRPELTLYTFETARMFVQHGIRLPLTVS